MIIDSIVASIRRNLVIRGADECAFVRPSLAEHVQCAFATTFKVRQIYYYCGE